MQKKDIFNTIKNIILKEYPAFKNKSIYFLVNGGIVEELKTIEENNIKTNSAILIADQDSFYL